MGKEHVFLAHQGRFSREKLQRVPVCDSDKLLLDQYCLESGQAQRVHSHSEQDKVYLVLEGQAVVSIGGEDELFAPGMAVIARAGVPHGVRNDSANRLVLLWAGGVLLELVEHGPA